MTVILINPFEIPEGNESEFLIGWSDVADKLSKEPGYISTKLHQSLDPKARFRFINVAEWESPALFQKAISKISGQESFRAVSAHANVALYQVVKADP